MIFGSSIGITDKKWRELIGENLEKRKCGLIYFAKDVNMDVVAHSNHKRHWIKTKVAFLKKRFDLPQDVDSYLTNIFVGLNTSVFGSIKIVQNTRNKKTDSVLVQFVLHVMTYLFVLNEFARN